jgi:hypothetical protein
LSEKRLNAFQFESLFLQFELLFWKDEVREWSEILHKYYWSKPTSTGRFIWKKYFQSHHVKKPLWSPLDTYSYESGTECEIIKIVTK